MMSKRIIFFLSLLLVSLSMVAQKSTPLLETKTPNLQFKKILNYDKEHDELQNYKEKVIILDFWATWCSSCVKAFPHLDALQSEFTDELQIFMVTASDSEERIKTFLRKLQTKLPIVLDSSGELSAKFPHRMISHTVVIDKKGIVRAISTPEKITSEVIRKIINNEKIDLEEKRDVLRSNSQVNKASSKVDNLKFQFTISGYNEKALNYLHPFGKDTVIISNQGIAGLHKTVHDYLFWSRVLFEIDNESKTLYELKRGHKYRPVNYKKDALCIEIIAPEMDIAAQKQFLLNYLTDNYNLRSKIEKRKRKVKVLQRTDDPLKLKSGTPDREMEGSMSGRGIYRYNSPISNLTFYLEGFGLLNPRLPVIDETGLNGKYDIEIPFYHEAPNEIYGELKKLGLELVEAEREIEMLILYEELESKERIMN